MPRTVNNSSQTKPQRSCTKRKVVAVNKYRLELHFLVTSRSRVHYYPIVFYTGVARATSPVNVGLSGVIYIKSFSYPRRKYLCLINNSKYFYLPIPKNIFLYFNLKISIVFLIILDLIFSPICIHFLYLYKWCETNRND